MKRIKNLNSINVFNSVSRLQNTTHAARLLNISQSSVSYHINKLETELGTSLFERKANGLSLTESGELLASYVERGLSTIQAGLEKTAINTEAVRIGVTPLFASRWLSTRLNRLWEVHPGIEVSFHSHANTYVQLDEPESFADLGIQWGRGDWDNFHVTRLWQEQLVVVCSPDYLEMHPINKASDLEGCTLIHMDDERMWREWFMSNRVGTSSMGTKLMLEDRHFQLNSTINGLGVSLFADWAVREELANGTLVNPFGRSFDTSFAYHLVTPRAGTLTPGASKFKDWFLESI